MPLSSDDTIALKHAGENKISGGFDLYYAVITEVRDLTYEQLNEIREVKDRTVRRTKQRYGLGEFAYSPAPAEANVVVTAREKPIQLVGGRDL